MDIIWTSFKLVRLTSLGFQCDDDDDDDDNYDDADDDDDVDEISYRS